MFKSFHFFPPDLLSVPNLKSKISVQPPNIIITKKKEIFFDWENPGEIHETKIWRGKVEDEIETSNAQIAEMFNNNINQTFEKQLKQKQFYKH